MGGEGYYEVLSGGEKLIEGGEFQDIETKLFKVGADGTSSEPSEMPSVESSSKPSTTTSLEPTRSPTVSDASSSPTVSDAPSRLCIDIEVRIKTDNHPSETSYDVKDLNGIVKMSRE